MQTDHIPFIWEYVVRRIFEISQISTLDQVLIVAEFSELLSGRRETPLSDLADRGYTEQQIEELTKKKLKTFSPITLMGIRYKKPLSNFKHPLLGYLLILLENYEKGLLPFPGTISEQPAQVVEMFSLLQSIKIEHQNKLNKMSETNSGRRNKN